MIKKMLFLFFVVSLGFSQTTLPLIPKPVKIQYLASEFVLDRNTVIQTNDANSFEAIYLKDAIRQQTGLNLQITSKYYQKNKILLVVEKDDLMFLKKEEYHLVVNNDVIEIFAINSRSLFYGVQSFLQMLPCQESSKIKVQGVSIIDYPKYAWRGMHLDCARHFFSVDFVKKYIDYLAMYKMNTFHWHLTDDQGWRIEIKKHPKLTEISAWRNGSMVGHYNDHKYDTIRHGGFYTQEEIREVVAYAAERHITVVPEIEMPGHAQAALAAYPEFSCTGGPFEVSKQWGVLDDVFCPKEETFTFLEEVLTEVVSLFPSEYIHIGGDECPKTRWKACAHCQSLIKEKSLKDEHGLQSYFVQRIEKFLNGKGKKIIGWDEILEGGLAPNAAVMSWRGTEGGIEAAKQHHQVVMSPVSHCYFDQYQGDSKTEPLTIGGFIPLEKVYAFHPTPEVLSLEESQYILGAQANVWTEYISTPEQIEYMAFPRITALAEVVWGTSNVSQYDDFLQRLKKHLLVLDKKGINYRKLTDAK